MEPPNPITNPLVQPARNVPTRSASMPMAKQVICIKWGTRYGPEYVNKIYAMVQRNITPPFTVTCFTDDRRGIREEVICHDLPELGCAIPPNVPGKWPKTALWGKELFGLQGVALYFDLDVVITGNLDDFFTYGSPDDVILARTWVRPLERLGQSSIFRFPIGKHPYLLDDLRRDPEGISTKYRFEQRYVTQCVKGGIKFWPRGWIKHFRRDCMGPWPMRYLRPARLPKGTRVVLFPSKPDPPDAIVGRWSERYQPTSRWDHIKRTFSSDRPPKSWYGHLKSYVMPCPWVAEHWRE